MIRIPTIAELQASIINDLESQFGFNIPTFGKVFLRPLAIVQAAKLKLFYLAVANVQRNIFADTAQSESVGGTLERFGRVKLNRNPFPARAGIYTVSVTGITGATIPAQSTFKSNDSSANPSKLYILDTAYTLSGSSGTIQLRALESGADSRLNISDTLTSTAPIANVNSIVTVTVEDTVPTDAESIETYRRLTLDAYRTEPQGGAPSDYRIWAADVSGVERVYPYAATGQVWQVNVFVEATTAASTDGKGTPSAGLLSDVVDVLNFDPDTTRPLNERGRKPLNVVLNVQPIDVLEVDIVVTGLVDNSSSNQTIITEALQNMVSQVRPFVAGADILVNKNDILNQNNIINTILNAVPNAVFSGVTLNVNSTPVSTYTFINGNIPNLNIVTFV